MIVQESKIVVEHLGDDKINESYVDGYFMTIHDLAELVRDFQVDCHDGFVSNDNSYIENWLKNHNRIVKTD